MIRLDTTHLFEHGKSFDGDDMSSCQLKLSAKIIVIFITYRSCSEPMLNGQHPE